MEDFDYHHNRSYFVTVCAKEKFELFGTIADGEMKFSEIGVIVKNEIDKMSDVYESVSITKCVIMPNHVHMIIKFRGVDAIVPALSQVVQQWKRAVSIQAGFSPWQKSFHDHIIRDKVGFENIFKYIDGNVKTWDADCFNPCRV